MTKLLWYFVSYENKPDETPMHLIRLQNHFDFQFALQNCKKGWSGKYKNGNTVAAC